MQNLTNTDPSLIDEDRGPAVLSVTIIFTVLSFVFVLLRVISRCFIVGRWKWDDWFIVFAWIIGFGFSLSVAFAKRNGLGRHSEFIPEADALPLRVSEYVFSILYNPVLMCTKTSICLFYLSVAKNQQFFRWGVYSTLALVNAAGLALTLVNVLQCHPPSALVSPSIPDATTCIDIVAIYLASAPVNIITDLALLLLPMPMLTAMRMPRKQKIILVVTFGFGLFVTVVDVVRIYYLQEAFETRINEVSRGNAITSARLDQDDFPWYAAYSFMWSAVEVHVGIMCASVPALKPLVARLMPNMLYDTHSQIEHSTWRRHRKRDVVRSCLCIGPPAESTVRSARSKYAQQYYNEGSQSPNGSEEKRSSAVVPLNDPSGFAALDQIRSHDFASDSEPPDSPAYRHVDRSSSLPSNEDGATVSDDRTEPDEEHPAAIRASHQQQQEERQGQVQQDRAADNDDSHPMDFMEFITTPDMPRTLTRQATIDTNATQPPTPDPRATFFDFYDVSGRKAMTELTVRESVLSISAVTVVFFLWGFAYGLLEQLNAQFQMLAHLNTVQTVALHSAYFGAYLITAPTIGQITLRKAGFKMTLICGLCVYACGALIFWPSAVLVSYPAFLVSNAIVGGGVGIIEVGADPFVALCGPMRYSEARLNLSQAIQAVGTVLAPLLAQKVLFVGVKNPESLIDAQWTYLAIALFDVALAVALYYVPIPEADDGDFETLRLRSLPEDRRISDDDRKLSRAAYLTLGVAVCSMFTYLGAQEVVATEYQGYVTTVGATLDHLKPFDWQLLGYSTFAIGRFVVAGLCLVVQPYILLGVCYVGITVTSALSLGLTGPAGASMLVLYEFFQGPIFPLIYAIGLRGLGKHTKWGAVALTSAISGGALWPIISAAVNGVRGPHVGICIGVACAAIGIGHPLYLALYAPARRQVNPDLGIGGTDDLQQSNREKKAGESKRRKRNQDVSGAVAVAGQRHDRDDGDEGRDDADGAHQENGRRSETGLQSDRQVLATLEEG